MNVGLKNAHRNHSQVGLKQDYSQAFVGIKKDMSIKENSRANGKNIQLADSKINENGRNRDPLGLYTHSNNQPKPVIQSNIERRKKMDKNGYNIDKNFVN
jgi:hypothetical protein